MYINLNVHILPYQISFQYRRGISRNSTVHGLELYRSFENESRVRGRSNPRWLEYSIHHNHNQITSLPTPRAVLSTTQPYFNVLEHRNQGLDNEANDDEAYYYNDLDSNADLSGRETADNLSFPGLVEFHAPQLTISSPNRPSNVHNGQLLNSSQRQADQTNSYGHVSFQTLHHTNAYDLEGQHTTVSARNQNNQIISTESTITNLLQTQAIPINHEEQRETLDNGKKLFLIFAPLIFQYKLFYL